ncbi:hypothetical protein QTP88_008518 [Uroleucon formosanum]
MDHQQNNKTPTSGSNSESAVGGDDEFNSEVLPGPNNRLEIAEHHITQTVEDTQDVYKLTTDELEFLNIVADTVRTAVAVRGNANEAPKKIIATESLQTDICVKSGGDAESLLHTYITTTVSEEGHIEKQKPVRKLKVQKRRNDTVRITTLKLSALLGRALRAAAVCRSLNYVISLNFRLYTTVHGIEEYPLANSAMTGYTEIVFRQWTSVEIVIQNRTTDSERGDIAMPEIQPPVLPAAICSRQTDDDVGFDGDDRPKAAKTVRRRKTILSTLRRRLLKAGRMLCCWCNAGPSEDAE